ncbi:glycoside hydrolase family 3 protein [Acidipropionibacterium thoenii]|uniref:glycoside hydrolase family 3 protein n=1 Tax=Acidipropionibacterium thoenii TaxID=1751 RepID=UPI000402F6D4|nr:glycoside hydrolase family 3 N-terminal domain-containing protein [Acidipropionibacterium thoenii]
MTSPDQLLASMTLAQKAGQLLVCEVYGTDPHTPHPKNLEHFGVPTAGQAIEDLNLGGVVYFRWTDSFDQGPQQLARLSNGLQQAALSSGAGIGLMVTTDQEQGPSSRFGPPATQFPGAMALGATGDLDAARRASAITGAELAAVGINLDFAPDADVNVNPANPVIGVRSFGSDPARVARFVASQVDGYQRDAGITACVKHFPGHGDTATDSHTGLPSIAHTGQQWEQTDLPPFRAAIDAGVDMVMSAHIRFPALEPSGEPATLSHRILTGLLRERLGFPGVIITDSLEMAGVRQSHPDAEVPVLALAAGADMILMPPDPRLARDAIVAAVESGRLSPSELDAKVLRVLELKARRGMLQPTPADPDVVLETVGRPDSSALAADLTRRAVTLVHQGALALPIAPEGLKVHVGGWNQAENLDLVSALSDLLAAAGAVPVADPDQADLVIWFTHDLAADPDQARELNGLAASPGHGPAGLLAVSVGVPYDLWQLPGSVTQLAVYSCAVTVPAAVLGALTDTRGPAGVCPVDLSVWHNRH